MIETPVDDDRVVRDAIDHARAAAAELVASVVDLRTVVRDKWLATIEK